MLLILLILVLFIIFFNHKKDIIRNTIHNVSAHDSILNKKSDKTVFLNDSILKEISKNPSQNSILKEINKNLTKIEINDKHDKNYFDDDNEQFSHININKQDPLYDGTYDDVCYKLDDNVLNNQGDFEFYRQKEIIDKVNELHLGDKDYNDKTIAEIYDELVKPVYNDIKRERTGEDHKITEAYQSDFKKTFKSYTYNVDNYEFYKDENMQNGGQMNGLYAFDKNTPNFGAIL